MRNETNSSRPDGLERCCLARRPALPLHSACQSACQAAVPGALAAVSSISPLLSRSSRTDGPRQWHCGSAALQQKEMRDVVTVILTTLYVSDGDSAFPVNLVNYTATISVLYVHRSRVRDLVAWRTLFDLCNILFINHVSRMSSGISFKK